MPLPPEQCIKFFVFVIESPSAADLYHRRSEGDLIRQAVELNGIPCVHKTAISMQAFDACLKIGLSEAMSSSTGYIPIIHISAHGDKDGIQLSDGHVLSWRTLREHLRPVNQALGGSLVVCMSSCQGYMGIRMAMYPEDPHLPYYALVGCGGKPSWAETAVAFTTFYHQLYRGEHISVAVEAMCVSSGNKQFWLDHAENSRQGFIEYINKATTPEEAQASLERILADEPLESQTNIKLLR